MWTNMIFVAYMSVTTVGQETDGTYNYLLETKSPYHRKYIALSTKQVIKYKLKQEFVARFSGECTDMMGVDDNWVTNLTYMCNADTVETSRHLFVSDTLEQRKD